MSDNAPGCLIVLEGLDGAGTTTQVERISEALRGEGRVVLSTREPSDGPVGLLIRQALTGRIQLPASRAPLVPETLALLFAADRMDHLAADVNPAIERGEIVVCDRYVLSSLAYQGVFSPMDWVDALNQSARIADLTLFLGVEPQTASDRRRRRGGPEELFEGDAQQKRIAQQYELAIRRRSVRERIVRIDGGMTQEAVTAECLKHIHALVGKKKAAG